MSMVGKENTYTCDTCGQFMVTVHVDDGVTPMLLRCRVSGCKGMGHSAWYRGRPEGAGEPRWEWFKPTERAIKRMTPEMQDHIRSGGLDLRERHD